MQYSKCKICSSDIISYMDEYKLVKCQNCGIIFFNEMQHVGLTKELYKHLYSEDAGYEQHRKQAIMIRNGIQPKLGCNKKVVLKTIVTGRKKYKIAEIGSGVGVVAKYLTDKGHDYIGYELNEDVAGEAQANGLPVKAYGFEGLAEYESYFDAILAFEVLEHIDDISGCFKIIAKALKNNGLIGFTVPNTDKFRNYEKVHSKLYQSNPPIHVNFFNTENLKKILPLFGFEPILLKVRAFPYFNFYDLNTYKFFLKAIAHKYHGPNIICVAKKVS